jgi:hypothetical protein
MVRTMVRTYHGTVRTRVHTRVPWYQNGTKVVTYAVTLQVRTYVLIVLCDVRTQRPRVSPLHLSACISSCF